MEKDAYFRHKNVPVVCIQINVRRTVESHINLLAFKKTVSTLRRYKENSRLSDFWFFLYCLLLECLRSSLKIFLAVSQQL